MLEESFALDETAFGYELRLQALFAQLWLLILEQHRPLSPAAPGRTDPSSEKVKQMLLFLHAHYAEKLSVSAIAAAAYCSERACYRCFQECLHTSPGEYLQDFRLQMASKLLIETDLPITEIAQHCAWAAAAISAHSSGSGSAVLPAPIGQNGRIRIHSGKKMIAFRQRPVLF